MNYVYFACRNSTTENACHPEACIQIQNVLIPSGDLSPSCSLSLPPGKCLFALCTYSRTQLVYIPLLHTLLPCALEFYTNIINISIQDISLFHSSKFTFCCLIWMRLDNDLERIKFYIWVCVCVGRSMLVKDAPLGDVDWIENICVQWQRQTISSWVAIILRYRARHSWDCHGEGRLSWWGRFFV